MLSLKVPADEGRFDSEKAALRDRLQQRAEATAVEHFLEQLKSKAQIQYGHGFGEGAGSQSERAEG